MRDETDNQMAGPRSSTALEVRDLVRRSAAAES